MLIVTGSVVARPDSIDQVLELSLAHVRRSREEPGCLMHSVHRDAENPLRLVFFEQWADAPALRTHFRVPASGAFVTEVTGLVSSPPQIAIYEAAPRRSDQTPFGIVVATGKLLAGGTADSMISRP